jgi:hypothetical protein
MRKHVDEIKKDLAISHTQHSSSEKEYMQNLNPKPHTTKSTNPNNNLIKLQALLKKYPSIDTVLLMKWFERLLDEIAIEFTSINRKCLRIVLDH